MAFALAPEARAAGYRLVAHDTIGSTNAEAMTYARAGESGPLWVVSDHQTAGRGRRGNLWTTPRGNLAASLLLTLDLPPARLALLGFVAGVALVRALKSLGPSAPVALKWPNDVMADGAKLSGILLETENTPRGRLVVIGIGVNVAHAPTGLPYRTTSLAELGITTSARDLFVALGREWLATLALWDEGRGFTALRGEWLAHAAGLGQPITVRQGQTDLSGVFDTMDEEGRLVLRTEDGMQHRISAGDVYFGGGTALPAGAAA